MEEILRQEPAARKKSDLSGVLPTRIVSNLHTPLSSLASVQDNQRLAVSILHPDSRSACLCDLVSRNLTSHGLDQPTFSPFAKRFQRALELV